MYVVWRLCRKGVIVYVSYDYSVGVGVGGDGALFLSDRATYNYEYTSSHIITCLLTLTLPCNEGGLGCLR